ncbi:MAG: hypothetical protein Q4C55_08705 [Eubacterium sp.]|nr:hypothetical protein [Eubacterium sp.]
MRDKKIVSLWMGILLMVLLTTGVFADEKIAPQVTTLDTDTITHESAILRGSYTAGTDAVKERGFMYRPADSTDDDYKTVKVPGDNTVARFGYTLHDLQDNTAYEAMAYVKTSDAIIEGAKVVFTTQAAPVDPATEVGETPATGAYDGLTGTALPAVCVLAMALAVVVMKQNRRFDA